MVPLRTGNVTFPFTDIEGSTRVREAARIALAASAGESLALSRRRLFSTR